MPLGTTTTALAALAHLILERNRWAQKMFGHNTIGAALFLCYVDDGRWVSAIELAELADVSEDTARRQLVKLARVGRVDERVIDRSRKYRLDPNVANRCAELAIKELAI